MLILGITACGDVTKPVPGNTTLTNAIIVVTNTLTLPTATKSAAPTSNLLTNSAMTATVAHSTVIATTTPADNYTTLALVITQSATIKETPGPTSSASISLTGNDILQTTKAVADVLIEMQIKPGNNGNSSVKIKLLNIADKQPLTNATEVSLKSNSTEMDMGLQSLKLELNGLTEPGTYQAQNLHLTMFGKWKLEVLIKRPSKNDVNASFEINVEQ